MGLDSGAVPTCTSVLTVVSRMKSLPKPLTSMLAAVPPFTTLSGTHCGSCTARAGGEGVDVSDGRRIGTPRYCVLEQGSATRPLRT